MIKSDLDVTNKSWEIERIEEVAGALHPLLKKGLSRLTSTELSLLVRHLDHVKDQGFVDGQWDIASKSLKETK